jgi:Tfp pilus assembly protein PilX
MNARFLDFHARAPQSGAVLFVCLMLLILLSLLAVTSSRGSGLQERMAGNMRQLSLAFETADSTHATNRQVALEYAQQRGMALATLGDARQIEQTLQTMAKSDDMDAFLDRATVDTGGVAVVTEISATAGRRTEALAVVTRYDRVSSLSSIEAGIATQDNLLFYKLTGVARGGNDGREAPVINSEIYVP